MPKSEQTLFVLSAASLVLSGARVAALFTPLMGSEEGESPGDDLGPVSVSGFVSAEWGRC